MKLMSRGCRYIIPASLLLLALNLAGCSKDSLHQYQSFSFGTLIEIKIRNEDKNLADKTASSLFTDFDQMHQQWHAWQPSMLTKTNAQLATGEWFIADPNILKLISLSKKFSLASENLFNPAIGSLIRAWGFQGQTPVKPPDQEIISSLIKNLPTLLDIEIQGDRLRGHNPQLQLDLGAVAKGYAVKLATQKLLVAGIRNGLVNAGGDLCGIGDQGQRPWRIGIRNPSGEGILASLSLKNNECVFTSGNYERYFDYDNKRYHHIIDPRSGYPANKSISVTVVHEDGALADAATTALFIAGPDDWLNIAAKMKVSNVMIVDTENNIYMTPSMQKRISFEGVTGKLIIQEITGQ